MRVCRNNTFIFVDVTINMRELKFVLIGNGFVGKTSLLLNFTQKCSPNQIPNVFDDNFSTVVTIDNEEIRINLRDTSGQRDFNWIKQFGLRIFQDTDVFIMSFAIDSRSSFDCVEEWNTETRALCPDVPTLLIGTKVDLRDNNTISFDEGKKLGQLIGAVKYLECSAKCESGVQEIFLAACNMVLKPANIKKRRKCHIC